MIEKYMTTYIGYETLTEEIMVYQQATLLFCFFIALSIYLLLPKHVQRNRKIAASVLIFIGLFGLFSILLKTLIRLIV
ncbi:hypothetical protein KY345_05000 [Candidatus Woesearchaeota archaeon]|nr:hypothetical protein [Candidatus Woesearchaeota archaeon]